MSRRRKQWLQELATRGIIKAVAPDTYETYPRSGEPISVLTPRQPSKFIAQRIARSAKGGEACITVGQYFREVAKHAERLCRVMPNVPEVLTAYRCTSYLLIPLLPSGEWARQAALQLPHFEEVLIEQLHITVGWPERVAAPIVDSLHSEEGSITEEANRIVRRLHQWPRPDRADEAIEVVTGVEQEAIERYERWLS